VAGQEDARAGVSEVFSSIQGEGCWLGRKQIFVRFAGCNLSCAYCDTDTSEHRLLAPSQLAEEVRLMAAGGGFHSISLTGGEPLLAGPGFISEFARSAAGTGLPLHLETNSTLPGALREVIDSIRYVSMDIKIPSATGQEARYEANREFLAIASGNADCRCCVKVVFTPQTLAQDIRDAAGVVAGVDAEMPFILQPATPKGPEQGFPSSGTILTFYNIALECLKDVRVIPQAHRFLGLR